MDIETFIERSNSIRDLGALKALMTEAIAEYGYEKIIYFSEIGPDFQPDEPTQKHLIDDYNTRNLKAADPVLHLFLTHNMPFTHKQITFGKISDEQRAIMELHRNSGMLTGVNFPLGNLSPRWVGITLGGEGNAARDDEKAVSQLYALVNQYVLRYAQISRLHPQTPWELKHITSGCYRSEDD